jgi:peptidoglycan/xylan/chitin deacetylase (PgdA/CDA1 family)
MADIGMGERAVFYGERKLVLSPLTLSFAIKLQIISASERMFLLAINKKHEEKLKIFITIDTEDAYFPVPRLITGEGIENEPGIYKMMDMMEKYDFKGNFFLDVYCYKYDTNYLREVASTIHNRGHSVELHSHPSKNLDFYKKNIYHYSLPDQIKILQYGKDLITEMTGKAPVAYRGGSYAFNEDTLYALNQVGIPIDSSLFYNHTNNQLTRFFTTNKITSYFNTIEVPVSYVKIINKNGEYTDSKFDVDWLNYEELVRVIELAKEHHLKTLTLFLHSFSFINKKTKPISEPENPEAIYRERSVGGTVFCEIYGPDEKDIRDFEKLLHYISNDPEIEVVTFNDWYNSEKKDKTYAGEDFVPVIDRMLSYRR